MTPQSFLENYNPYGFSIVAGKKMLAHICTFLRKKVCISNQNFTDGFLVKLYFFPAIAKKAPTRVCPIYTLLYDWAQFRNLMLLRYERLT